MIRRILVGLGDEQYAASATRIALELARQNKAELTGLCVLDEETVGYTGSVPIGAGHFAQELREQRIAETKNGIWLAPKTPSPASWFGWRATRRIACCSFVCFGN